jgi:8-amino-7-oxononanoate synthase
MPTTDTVPSVRERLLSDLSDELQALERGGLRRRLTAIEAVRGPMVRVQGRELVCWCSNDYLGLSGHPALATAASRAAAEWGIGARASRLLAGTTSCHVQLEASLAAFFGAEAALVFPSGYLANLGTLRALLAPEDAVFVDRLAHASLIEATRQTGARFRLFAHNDLDQLDALVAREPRARRRIIVSEGVFSMEGDQAPLSALVALAERHEALLYLDDAHGAFVVGQTGRGTPEAAGVGHERLLYMGTLGKGLGCQGGFVIGPRVLIEYLHNRARSFIYATALAVPVAAAACEALRIVALEPQRRWRLAERSAQLHEALSGAGLRRLDAGPSHIVPVVVGEAARASALAARLWAAGIWAPAIRPPTVPRGAARLRLSVTAPHEPDHTEALVAALREGLRAS